MPKLKILSGEKIIKIFLSFDFVIVAQKGSHIKLARVLSAGVRQTLTIPNHQELDRGTLKAIYRQALRYIPENELKNYFYAE
ncbi:type II toxin-antitoxin system HicA family toxin [Candidatus Parcubacteria bacterium]|nr:type II toxin-antitoxin system HicA family toxin [Candidatus Parcubacteria bacterium]NCS99906.1 type II toxin-antitoxin system HicA family toxin [Candidatus Parcubacteria bacterium]